MEYERIHKAQSGLISPSKLRMKLMGSPNQKRKDGSNSNSTRTSPSKLHDSEFVKDGLLSLQDGDFDDEGSAALSVPYATQPNKPNGSMQRVVGDTGGVKMPQFSKVEVGNLSTVHPMRTTDDENLDYDSNASSSSFEFHKGDNNNRSLHHNPISRSFQRSMPSKWNDAEKWIMNRQNTHYNSSSNRTGSQAQANRLPAANTVKVAPEYVYNDHKLLVNRIAQTKRVEFCQPVSHMGLDKFSFAPEETEPVSSQASIRTCPQIRELHEVDHQELSSTVESSAGVPGIRSVSMRDMGTEMTPIASQEPSRTGTPAGATTPLRSPTSSVPSTPRQGDPAFTSLDNTTQGNSSCPIENNDNKQLSEQDLKLNTRKEIVALGVKLGKTNIAAWASKDDKEKNNSPSKNTDRDELDRIEFERRALVWEEVEKSKHTSRYKREEIKIEAWESQQKAKLEAEMRRIEAKVEQMRAQAEAKMVKMIAMTRQRAEEKRAAAEAKKNEQAARATAQADYIRQTGQFPSSSFICCGWFR